MPELDAWISGRQMHGERPEMVVGAERWVNFVLLGQSCSIVGHNSLRGPLKHPGTVLECLHLPLLFLCPQ